MEKRRRCFGEGRRVRQPFYVGAPVVWGPATTETSTDGSLRGRGGVVQRLITVVCTSGRLRGDTQGAVGGVDPPPGSGIGDLPGDGTPYRGEDVDTGSWWGFRTHTETEGLGLKTERVGTQGSRRGVGDLTIQGGVARGFGEAAGRVSGRGPRGGCGRVGTDPTTT